jgi:hypothetical protein
MGVVESIRHEVADLKLKGHYPNHGRERGQTGKGTGKGERGGKGTA